MPKDKTEEKKAEIGDNGAPFNVSREEFIEAWNKEHELQEKAAAIAGDRKKFHGHLKTLGIKVVDWKAFLRLDSLSRGERAHFDRMRAKFEVYLKRRPGTQIEMPIDDDDLSDEELEAQEVQRAEEDGWNAGLKGLKDETDHNYSPGTPAANAFVGAYRDAQATLASRMGKTDAEKAEAAAKPDPTDGMTERDFKDDDFPGGEEQVEAAESADAA